MAKSSHNSGCGTVILTLVAATMGFSYLKHQRQAIPAPAVASHQPTVAALPVPKTPLADLIVGDTSNFQTYAKKFGAWDYDSERGTMITSGANGDKHHVEGVGDISLSYVKTNPKAWLYVIEPAQATIDTIAPDNDQNLDHINSTSDTDLYRIKTGVLTGDFIRTSGYSDPNDLRIDVYTPQLQKLFYPEEISK